MSLQTYVPFVCDISAIESEEATTLVTTAIDHAFVAGCLVAFQIPSQYGMRQLNGLSAYVIEVPASDQILLNINTSTFDAFIVPSVGPYVVLDPAQAIPAGDANSGTVAHGGTLDSLTIPGAYTAVVN